MTAGPDLRPGALEPLERTICPSCDVALSYPRPHCPGCASPTTSQAQLWPGRVVSVTTVHRAPAGSTFGTPYDVALIACEGGMVLARVAGVTFDELVLVGQARSAADDPYPVALPADH